MLYITYAHVKITFFSKFFFREAHACHYPVDSGWAVPAFSSIMLSLILGLGIQPDMDSALVRDKIKKFKGQLALLKKESEHVKCQSLFASHFALPTHLKKDQLQPVLLFFPMILVR